MSYYYGQTAGGNSRQHNGNVYNTNNYHGPPQQPQWYFRQEREQQNENLVKAAGEGQLQRVQCLLRAGANVDHVDSEGYTALTRAARYQRNAVVDVLISAGADVNATAAKFREKTTALGFAVNNDNKDIAEVLIRAGANVNAEPGPSYLMSALSMKHYGVAEILLAAGADTERKDTGSTALEWASFASDEHAVELLLAAGANLNPKDLNGLTPLHYVAGRLGGEGDEIARMLIRAGAKTNICDNRGETAEDVAKKRYNTSMLDILLYTSNGRSL